ncbi:collagen-binding domain-containing protein [Clostridium oceanicum]|uniref:Choice-of-anchor A domain-containing protein n=1 Tax=Clostridium oceanicum TaxID=1543 RepID=A0ABP3UMZ2_9CLOT
MKNKSKKNIANILLISLIINILISFGINNKVFAHPTLGDINHYNGIVFGNMSAENADSEGPVAVLGNLNAPTSNSGESYSVYMDSRSAVMGIPYPVNDYCALVVGGTLSKSSNRNSNLMAQSVTITNEQFKNIFPNWMHRAIRVLPKQTITNAFDEYKRDINSAIQKVNKLYDNFPNNSTDEKIVQSPTNDRVKIANINNIDELKNGNTIDLGNLENSDFLIIKSNQSSVNFNFGTLTYNGDRLTTTFIKNNKNTLAQVFKKILWVFPNADTINLSSTELVGNVLAPNATLTGRGNAIDGQAIVENLHQRQGFELHSFRFDWNLFKNLQLSKPEVVEPQPEIITPKPQVIEPQPEESTPWIPLTPAKESIPWTELTPAIHTIPWYTLTPATKQWTDTFVTPEPQVLQPLPKPQEVPPLTWTDTFVTPEPQMLQPLPKPQEVPPLTWTDTFVTPEPQMLQPLPKPQEIPPLTWTDTFVTPEPQMLQPLPNPQEIPPLTWTDTFVTPEPQILQPLPKPQEVPPLTWTDTFVTPEPQMLQPLPKPQEIPPLTWTDTFVTPEPQILQPLPKPQEVPPLTWIDTFVTPEPQMLQPLPKPQEIPPLTWTDTFVTPEPQMLQPLPKPQEIPPLTWTDTFVTPKPQILQPLPPAITVPTMLPVQTIKTQIPVPQKVPTIPTIIKSKILKPKKKKNTEPILVTLKPKTTNNIPIIKTKDIPIKVTTSPKKTTPKTNIVKTIKNYNPKTGDKGVFVNIVLLTLSLIGLFLIKVLNIKKSYEK